MRHMGKTAVDYHGLIGASVNHQFKTKSLIRYLCDAFWIPNRIPNNGVPIITALAGIRLMRAKKSTNPATGKTTLEDTTIAQRFRKQGIDNTKILNITSCLERITEDPNFEIPESVLASLPKGYSASDLVRSSIRDTTGICNEHFYKLLESDIKRDVCLGALPMLGLNYMSVTLLHVFQPRRGKAKGTPVSNRASLAILVLESEDDEVLSVIPEYLEKVRAGYTGFMPWEDDQLDHGRNLSEDEAFDDHGFVF
ncbi:uncharacterized protein BDV17DRAFT_292704 [Aspergillus undulatus]|uniref:uncharacterized protein n=1 Tax=Aspergillus undulatus TaxID=1810928 RepID=UPI003CCCA23A